MRQWYTRFAWRPLDGQAHSIDKGRALFAREPLSDLAGIRGVGSVSVPVSKSGLGARERYTPACSGLVFPPVALSQVVCRHYRPGSGMPLERALVCTCACACACACACVVLRGAALCCIMLRALCGVVRCCAVLCGVVRCCALLCGSVRCCALPCGSVQCCACACLCARAYVCVLMCAGAGAGGCGCGCGCGCGVCTVGSVCGACASAVPYTHTAYILLLCTIMACTDAAYASITYAVVPDVGMEYVAMACTAMGHSHV